MASTTKLTLTPALVIHALASIITEAVAFGLLDKGVAQTVIGLAGIIVPAAFALASGLHLGLVHAAVVKQTPVTALGTADGAKVQP